jgi:hypothetical protein
MSPRDREGTPSAIEVNIETSATGEELPPSNDKKPTITQSRRLTVRRKANRKNDVPFAMFREWIVQHQIGESERSESWEY